MIVITQKKRSTLAKYKKENKAQKTRFIKKNPLQMQFLYPKILYALASFATISDYMGNSFWDEQNSKKKQIS